MNDDSIAHLWVKMEEDPVLKHVRFQLDIWQKCVASSCWIQLILKCNKKATIIRVQCVRFPGVHHWVFLIEVVHRVWNYRETIESKNKYLLDHNTSDSFPQTVCLVVDAVKDFHDSFRSIAVLLEMIKPLGRPVFFPVIAILVLEQHFCLICIKTISWLVSMTWLTVSGQHEILTILLRSVIPL